MTRTESRRLVKDGGGVTVELHSGSCGLDEGLRQEADRGINGIARYSDEAYEAFARMGQEQPPRRFPTCPTRFPPVRGGIN